MFATDDIPHPIIVQSILKEISPGISLEGMMLKLKLQYFGYVVQRVHSLEKTLMLGGIGGRRRRGPLPFAKAEIITPIFVRSMDLACSTLLTSNGNDFLTYLPLVCECCEVRNLASSICLFQIPKHNDWHYNRCPIIVS